MTTTTNKVYAVVLYDQAAEELGPLGRLFLRQGSYIYAKTVEPEGQYFHMRVEHKAPDGSVVEFELLLPHSSIKAVFSGGDVKRLGFV